MDFLTILIIRCGGRHTVQVLVDRSTTRRLLTELAKYFLQARLRDAEATLGLVVAIRDLH